MKIVAGLAGLCLVSGCDFLRASAGRPTSAQIARARAAMAAASDSLSAIIMAADTVAGHPELEGADFNCYSVKEKVASVLPYRFYVSVGTYSVEENASRQADAARRSGFEPTIVRFTNGRLCVGLCPSDDINLAKLSLLELTGRPFCPKDVCIIAVR